MYSARHFFNINDLFRQASNRKIMIPIRIRSKTSGSFLSILYPQHRKYLSMRTAFLGRIHILLFALSFFWGRNVRPPYGSIFCADCRDVSCIKLVTLTSMWNILHTFSHNPAAIFLFRITLW